MFEFAWMCKYVWQPGIDFSSLPLLLSELFLERGSHCFGQTCWPASSKDLTVTTVPFQYWGFRCMQGLAFYLVLRIWTQVLVSTSKHFTHGAISSAPWAYFLNQRIKQNKDLRKYRFCSYLNSWGFSSVRLTHDWSLEICEILPVFVLPDWSKGETICLSPQSWEGVLYPLKVSSCD